jgi:squalene synthase HpnC
MSADAHVIICVSIKTCDQIEIVTRNGTGASGGLRTGVRPAPAIADGADEANLLAGQAAGENFPVALRLVPARHRRHLMAVYGFARTVDDIGDEAPPDQRFGLLDELEADLRRLYARSGGQGDARTAGGGAGDAGRAGDGGRAGGGAGDGGRAGGGAGDGGRAGGGAGDAGRAGDGAGDAGRAGDGGRVGRGAGDGGAGGEREGPRSRVVRELAPTVAECAIPMQPFLDLIQANRQDQVVSRYPTFDDLLGYCRLSANPVGRIVLHVFGSFTQQRAELSDSVCTALQLAEHWQDVAEDLRAGRIYLPADDMASHGCTERDLAGATAGPAVRALVAFETRRARELLDAGAPLIGMLRGSARAAVAGYVAGGRAALAAIAAADHDVLRATHKPGKRRVAAEMILAYARGR